MNITPAILYWILKLDDIRATATGPTIIFPIVGAMVFIALKVACFMADSEGEEEITTACRKAARMLWWPVPWLAVVVLICAFVPTTKQAAVIFAVPTALNSQFVTETLPEEGRELYELAKMWLKEQSEKPEKPAKGETK